MMDSSTFSELAMAYLATVAPDRGYCGVEHTFPVSSILPRRSPCRLAPVPPAELSLGVVVPVDFKPNLTPRL